MACMERHWELEVADDLKDAEQVALVVLFRESASPLRLGLPKTKQKELGGKGRHSSRVHMHVW